MIPCGPLPVVAALAMGAGAVDTSCGLFDLDVGGRAYASFPDTGQARGVRLERGRLELGARTEADVALRLALVEARSGGPDGYVGVAGEAFVPVLEVAEARWDWRATGLAVAVGVVDDPLAATLEQAWDHREIAPVLAAGQGVVARSDEGGWLSFTAPEDRLTATVAVLGGEGAATRERNDGLDLAGLVVVRPIPELSLAVYGREGSTGLLQARSHRAAAAVIGSTAWVAGGVDATLGWGLDGDGALRPMAASAYVRAGSEAPFVAWLRGDLAQADRGSTASRDTGWLVGGGPRLARRTELAVVVGYEGHRYGLDAAPIAGTERVTGSDLVFVQIGGRLRATWEINVP